MITLSHCYVSKNKTQKMLRGSRFTLQKNTTRSHEHQCSLLPDIEGINKRTETRVFYTYLLWPCQLFPPILREEEKLKVFL